MNIEELCNQVEYGTKRRFNCPVCKGFNSLSISKEDGKLMYNCYKNSCTLKPMIKPLLVRTDELRDIIASRKPLEAHTEEKEVFDIPKHWIMGLGSKTCFQMLLTTNSIDSYLKHLFKIAYDPRLDRLVYLIQDDSNNIIGGVGRALGHGYPKSHNYNRDVIKPFTCGTGKIGVIVEDCASACSIARFDEYTGIALLGTHCSANYLFYIIANYEHIIISLDADAESKAIQLRKSIKYYTKEVEIWHTLKDLKNMTKEEINLHRYALYG